MARVGDKQSSDFETFDEKQFYLDEFRTKTLLFSIPSSELGDEESEVALAAIVRDLLLNDSRVILLVSTDDAAAATRVLRRLRRHLAPLIFRRGIPRLFRPRGARAAAVTRATSLDVTTFLSDLWTTMRAGPLFIGVTTQPKPGCLHDFAQQVAARLRVHKLVLIEPEGGLRGEDTNPLSFLDDNILETLLEAGQAEWAGLAHRRAVLEVVRAGLVGGVSSVNLCTLAGAARELFTYEGSGTLFTLADYCRVQRLGIDDFEEVERLIERGQREGVLKPRTADEIADIVVHGYGATIGAHHLAGICALITQPYATSRAGEIVGLYTITRFKGEGVGVKLVARVLDDARDAGLAYVFACTMEERAKSFFERQGFRSVRPSDVPRAKWRAYDPKRKARVAVLRIDLDVRGNA